MQKNSLFFDVVSKLYLHESGRKINTETYSPSIDTVCGFCSTCEAKKQKLSRGDKGENMMFIPQEHRYSYRIRIRIQNPLGFTVLCFLSLSLSLRTLVICSWITVKQIKSLKCLKCPEQAKATKTVCACACTINPAASSCACGFLFCFNFLSVCLCVLSSRRFIYFILFLVGLVDSILVHTL